MEQIYPITEVNEPLLKALAELLAELGVQEPEVQIRQFERMLQAPNTRLFVAREGEKIVGMTTVAWYDTLMARRGWVEDVAVKATMQGRGLGRRLIKTAIAWAKEEGIETLSLSSAPHRIAARRLYQEEGFAPVPTDLFRLKP
uniref:N-acetyltransferase family protein n=1 Tax=Alistipes sp. TaxID=1872444 RepID=UPI004055A9F9